VHPHSALINRPKRIGFSLLSLLLIVSGLSAISVIEAPKADANSVWSSCTTGLANTSTDAVEVITNVAGRCIITFKQGQTFTLPLGVTSLSEALVVGGGGGGGFNSLGGGGGGGEVKYRTTSLSLSGVTQLVVTIGAGGLDGWGDASSGSWTYGENGYPSEIRNQSNTLIIAAGGGGGGCGANNYRAASTFSGSAGGACYQGSWRPAGDALTDPTSGWTRYANRGGPGGSGGGGGAGQIPTGVNGGNGITLSGGVLTGTYGGGGGGWSGGATGGSGGGGTPITGSYQSAGDDRRTGTDGTANTGGGGGAAKWGGSGVVRIVYTIPVTVTFKSNYVGGASDTTQAIPSGVSTALAANSFARTGYTFAGWTANSDGTGTSFTNTQSVTISANTSFHAKWTINTYAITVTQGSNGTISPGTTNVNYGSNQTFTFTPSSGYSVASITVNGSALSGSALTNAIASGYTFSNVGEIGTVAATYVKDRVNQATLSFTLDFNAKSHPYSRAITMTPSGGSGTGVVTFAIVAGGSATGCSLANNTASNTISADTSGTCLIQATKPQDVDYFAATSSAVTFTFNKLTQDALTITANNFRRGETTSVLATGGNTSETIAYSASGACSILTTTLSSSGTGTCEIVATRAGNSIYELVTATKSINVLPSNVTTLAGLAVTPGTSVFNPATSTYAISVSSTVSTIRFTPTFTSTFASATFAGDAITSGTLKTYTPTAGANTPFNVVVTAEDGVTTQTYIVKVMKVVTTKSSTSTRVTPTPTPTPSPTPTPTQNTTQPIRVPTVSVAPKITGLSVTSGAVGASVTITGTNLSTTLSVRLSGKPAEISLRSDTQLVVTVPSGARSGVITITSARGSATSARFTVTP
jgi:uncharacterized repeat protein (TIGR02543 family)